MICVTKKRVRTQKQFKMQQKAVEKVFDCFLDGKGCVPEQYDYG